MTVPISDWQLEQGGLWVGEGTQIDLTSLDTGSPDTRGQDVPATQADARIFGRDRRTPGQWSMVLSVNAGSESAALDLLEAFSATWDSDEVRETPGAVVPLRYRINGRTRRVYGRPRRFTPVWANLVFGHVPVAYDFALADTNIYSDDEDAVQLGVGAAQLVNQGITFPLEFPVLWGEPGSPQTKTAQIAGSKPTWLTVRFNGPTSGGVTDPYVYVGPNRIALRGDVPANTSVTLSGASWNQGAFWEDGTTAGDLIDPTTRLANLRIKPGSHAVTFGGIDATGTATAVVSWRNAYSML